MCGINPYLKLLKEEVIFSYMVNLVKSVLPGGKLPGSRSFHCSDDVVSKGHKNDSLLTKKIKNRIRDPPTRRAQLFSKSPTVEP